MAIFNSYFDITRGKLFIARPIRSLQGHSNGPVPRPKAAKEPYFELVTVSWRFLSLGSTSWRVEHSNIPLLSKVECFWYIIHSQSNIRHENDTISIPCSQFSAIAQGGFPSLPSGKHSCCMLLLDWIVSSTLDAICREASYADRRFQQCSRPVTAVEW